MKDFVVVTFADGDWTARITVRAGVPELKDGMISLAMGVERGVPVVVIGQDSGDAKLRQGSQLQAITTQHARMLAALLLEAVDEVDGDAASPKKNTTVAINQKTIDLVIAYVDERRQCIERTDGRLHGISRGPYLSAWDDIREELAVGAVQRWAKKKSNG